MWLTKIGSLGSDDTRRKQTSYNIYKLPRQPIEILDLNKPLRLSQVQRIYKIPETTRKNYLLNLDLKTWSSFKRKFNEST